MYKVAPTRT